MSSLRSYLFSDYLEENEQIMFVSHRHIIVLFRDFLRIFAVHFGIALFVWFLFPQILWICIAWCAIGFVRFLLVLQDWYYDAWLITNMGIVGVQWTGYFNRTSTRVEYASIEGVSYNIKGFLPTVLNYGNVTLAKLGGPSTVTLKDAYNPKKVEKNILQFQEEFLTTKNFKDQEVLKALLSDLVADHVKKHGLPQAMQEDITINTVKKK
ncbi:hypothetical protein JW911_00590 [Candidatus Peregrinibacteria bacterium]|nr:hypothetical protein [Candidatus Peregrinibacteria bacterium]